MLKDFFEQFADLIYKQKCVVCGCSKTNEILCKNCLKSVQKLSPFAQRKVQGVNIFCAFRYESTIKNLIRNFKFNKRKSAAKPAASLLFEYFKRVCRENDLNLNPKNSVLVCIPSHQFRIFQRGYCHTELILKEFSYLTGIKADFSIIKKTKNTTPQYKIRADKKAQNVRGAFKVRLNKKYKDKTIILIDDLTTTGATLNEAVCELKKASYDNIICFTLAC